MSNNQELRRKHSDVRQRACALVEAALADEFPQIRLTEIDAKARTQANSWFAEARLYGASTAQVPNWDWNQLHRRISERARHVELAVWHNDLLYGMAVGRVSRRRVVAAIHYLQRSPIASLPDVSLGRIATAFLVAVANEWGCREVAVDSPFKQLIGYYKSLGFTKEIVKGKRVVRLVYPLSTLPID